MSRIFLDLQIGLGDMIIANGLIRELSKVNECVAFPYHQHNLQSINNMFVYLNNVYCCNPSDDDLDSFTKLVIGQNNPEFGTIAKSFDESMYKLAGIDFEKRWSSFHIPLSCYVRSAPINRFILIHDDRARGYVVDTNKVRKDLQIIYVDKNNFPISHWIPVIREAEEIHCINSSILHLSESVETNGRLFFHKYARPFTRFDIPVLRKDWNILE